jgi:phosphate transport system protein
MAPTRRVLTSEETRARDRLIELSGEADAAIARALSGFRNQDTTLAQQVVEGDAQINDLQREIEQGCFTAIALQQPMASDLRDLVSDMHIASELERIADHAAAIAKIVLQMDAPPLAAFVGSIERLGEECRRMLASVMTAYQKRDEQRARRAAAEDDGVDSLETQITADLLTHLSANPGQVTSCTHALWVVHNIERIGDRVTNIAERVVFMVTGQYVDLNR